MNSHRNPQFIHKENFNLYVKYYIIGLYELYEYNRIICVLIKLYCDKRKSIYTCKKFIYVCNIGPEINLPRIEKGLYC